MTERSPSLAAWRLERYPELGSTSDLCRARAEAGEPDGLAIQTYRQTAGRGTHGKAWTDPGGNLALSVLIRPRPDLVPYLAFVIALALGDAFEPADTILPRKLVLKWPNDIMFDGRKLAGILIEVGGPIQNPWVVVGMGVNIAHAPAVPDRAVACLADAGIASTPDAAADAVLTMLTRWFAVLSDDGFGPVREAWLTRAHPLGTRLAIRRGHEYVEGLFHGLEPNGALLLQTDSGEIVRSVAGDVRLVG